MAPMKIIDRYILKCHIGPYFFGLTIITFIFVMDFIFRYLDLFIGKGVSFPVVLEFFVLSLGYMFALIIPMAVMPATLMAFGQLASENEITALKASGVSLYRMILPILIASACLSALLIVYNNIILPESNHRLMNLMIDIGRMRPTIEIKENIFSDAVKGYSILIKEKNDKTGEIKDIQIFQKNKKGIPTTISAKRGKMKYIEDENILRFELEDGEIHEMPDPQDISTYRRTTFKNFILNIHDTERGLKRSKRTYRGDREMSAGMMKEKIEQIEDEIETIKEHMRKVAEKYILTRTSLVFPGLNKYTLPEKSQEVDQEGAALDSGNGNRLSQHKRRSSDITLQILKVLENDAHIIASHRNQISRYKVEIHKKFSIPFSCIIFILIGAPLAIRSGKKGMTMSIGFSILFFLIYYIFLISGEKLADRMLVEPWLAMWLPNIVLGTAGVALLHSTVQETRTINWSKLNIIKRWKSEDSR